MPEHLPPAPPRVAVVAGRYEPAKDGVSAYTARLVTALGHAGVPAAVVAGHGCGPGSLRRWAADGDLVHVQFAPSAYRYRPHVGLLPLLAGGRPLVVTLHEYGWWSWRPSGLPVAVAEVAWRGAERRGWWDRETLLLTTRASAVVVTNAAHQAEVRRRLPRLRAPVEAIPIGANVEPGDPARGDERPALRHRLGAPPDAPVVAFFGFVHPVKGIPYLLDAVAALGDLPALRLVLLGSFESLALPGAEAAAYRSEVERGVAERGLAGRVVVTGYRPEEEVTEVLRGVDAVALPFTAGVTAKSGSLLTALAHRVPVVATAASPRDPTLVDQRHLLLVPPRRSDALAAALRRVLNDRGLGRRLAAAGEGWAATRRWDGIAAAHAELYRRVAAARR